MALSLIGVGLSLVEIFVVCMYLACWCITLVYLNATDFDIYEVHFQRRSICVGCGYHLSSFYAEGVYIPVRHLCSLWLLLSYRKIQGNLHSDTEWLRLTKYL